MIDKFLDWLLGPKYYFLYDDLGRGPRYYVYQRTLFGKGKELGNTTDRKFAEYMVDKRNRGG